MENRNMIEQKKDPEEISKKTSVSRRKFLKKTAYATPSLIILGALSKPVTAHASVVDDTGFNGGNQYGGGPGNL